TRSKLSLALYLIEKDSVQLQEIGFRYLLEIAIQMEPQELSSIAKFNLAVCFEYGIGVDKSLEMAQKSFLQAGNDGIQQGFLRAQECKKKSEKQMQVCQLSAEKTDLLFSRLVSELDFLGKFLYGNKKINFAGFVYHDPETHFRMAESYWYGKEIQ